MRKLIHSIAVLCAAAAPAWLNGCGAPFDNVFLGDSITAFWSVPGANRGVPGDTTEKMLARFPAQVPGHGYRTLIILGGTNDVRYTLSLDEAIADLNAMAKTARAGGMQVVLCEIPPIYEDRFKLDPAVRQLNGMIRDLAASEHYSLVDYYSPMIGHPEYFKDQLHPNALGYSVMDKALVPVLESVGR